MTAGVKAAYGVSQPKAGKKGKGGSAGPVKKMNKSIQKPSSGNKCPKGLGFELSRSGKQWFKG